MIWEKSGQGGPAPLDPLLMTHAQGIAAIIDDDLFYPSLFLPPCFASLSTPPASQSLPLKTHLARIIFLHEFCKITSLSELNVRGEGGPGTVTAHCENCRNESRRGRFFGMARP